MFKVLINIFEKYLLMIIKVPEKITIVRRITVFSRIEAAASICFFYFLVRLLFEGGFYSRAASIYRNSLSVIRQMALFTLFTVTDGGCP